MTDLPDLPIDSPAASPEAAPIESARLLPTPPEPHLAAPRTDGSAVAALLCAIGSWFLPVALAVVALVLARKAELAIDARPAQLTGRGLVTGARWIAWTHLVLAAMVVAFVSAFAIAVWTGR